MRDGAGQRELAQQAEVVRGGPARDGQQDGDLKELHRRGGDARQGEVAPEPAQLRLARAAQRTERFDEEEQEEDRRQRARDEPGRDGLRHGEDDIRRLAW